MPVQHKDIQHAECHEPRHITTAGTSDSGKVITPSAIDAGRSELRNLTPVEVGALPAAGGTASGKININHADGLEVLGEKVVGGQQAAIPNADAGTIADNSGDADTASVQDSVDALEGTINLILAALRAHGLIAT